MNTFSMWFRALAKPAIFQHIPDNSRKPRQDTARKKDTAGCGVLNDLLRFFLYLICHHSRSSKKPRQDVFTEPCDRGGHAVCDLLLHRI